MLHSVSTSARRHLPSSILVLLLSAALYLFNAPTTLAQSHIHYGMVSSFKNITHIKRWSTSAAPTDARCRATLGVVCYSPREIQNAYNLTPLLNAGYNGKGQTIVIIDSYGSPTALTDLQRFDADYGLPDPPSFKVISPLSTVSFDPNNSEQIGWAAETSLDIQWSHVLAPGANIVVLTSPISETQGVQGMPEFLRLEQYALDAHLGNIITQSWGTTENTLFTPAGRKVLHDFEHIYQRAASMGVTVLAAAGDSGTANSDINGKTYPFPTVIYPASSPWVTAVGGTSLYADTAGNYQTEFAWNDGIGNATGGGVSQYFNKPGYQTQLPKTDQILILKGHRGLPDIAFNADPRTGYPVYLGFLPADYQGYYLFGGTSAGSPAWAGLIADANQKAFHALGFLNPALYRIGHGGQAAGKYFHDIVFGNNAQLPVHGYNATLGWDATTGWGTPIAQPLLNKLAQMP